MSPQRIQLKHTRGWRLPPNTVVVARPSKWGNPYKVGTRHPFYSMLIDPSRACLDFMGLLAGDPEMVSEFIGPADAADRQAWMREHLTDLRGKNLACWCPILDANGDRFHCHADILLDLANPGEGPLDLGTPWWLANGGES